MGVLIISVLDLISFKILTLAYFPGLHILETDLIYKLVLNKSVFEVTPKIAKQLILKVIWLIDLLRLPNVQYFPMDFYINFGQEWTF